MKYPFFLGAFVAISAAAQAFAANATFSVQTYPILGNTQIAADFNGDGKLDLAGGGGMRVSLMLNRGDGTFAPMTQFPLATYTQDVAAGDFNGDGKTDLVVTMQSQQQSIAFLPGTGTGSFGAPTYYPNPSGFDSPQVIASDINNDAKLDVVIMHSVDCFGPEPCHGARIVTVMLGNGDGTFQPGRDIDVNTFPHAMAIGDFNRDGIKDLAVGGENTELSILLGTGGGNFALQPVMLLVDGGDLFSACNDVDVADFNRDGIQDIVVPLGNGYGNVVMLGNGDGTFRVFTRYIDEAVSSPNSDAVADFNGDGFLDIARGMADGLRGLIHVLHGNGDGTFQPIARYAVPSTLTNQGGGWLIAADLNGDTKPDIAAEIRGSGATDVFLNTSGTAVQPTTPIVADVTLSPSSVTGGGSSVGTVTLSTTAQAATTVRLASSSSNAAVPASVIVSAATTSATFNVTTRQVTSATSARITASANGSSRVATLTINPRTAAPTPTPAPTPVATPAPTATPVPTATPAPSATADTVSIARAEYETAKRTLRIEASSSKSTATLQAFVTSTNQPIGTLTNNGGGKYSGQFTLSANPQNITVRSNLGGAKSVNVTRSRWVAGELVRVAH